MLNVLLEYSFKYVRKIFRKTNISYPLICTRTYAYQGVKNVSFSENFAYVLNGWPLGSLFFRLTYLFLLVQLSRRDRSTYERNIFFHTICTFAVMTHYVTEESFFKKNSAILLNITPGIWILQPSFFAERF